jgi:hypothetical protein
MGVVLPPALGSSVVGKRLEVSVAVDLKGRMQGAGVGHGCGWRDRMTFGRREAVQAW